MNKNIAIASAIVLVVFASAGSSQVVAPAMQHYRVSELPATHNDDGRVVRRVTAATLGLIRVEWPAGTRTTPHNHAAELIVYLVEGRMRAFSGGQELMLEAGDAVVFPSYVEHSYEALEDSVTVEAAGPG